VRYLAARNRIHTLARNAPLSLVVSELGSPVDRPDSKMAGPVAKRLLMGFAERRSLRKGWVRNPREVWQSWAGRDEVW
jgi:hypothetical protein